MTIEAATKPSLFHPVPEVQKRVKNPRRKAMKHLVINNTYETMVRGVAAALAKKLASQGIAVQNLAITELAETAIASVFREQAITQDWTREIVYDFAIEKRDIAIFESLVRGATFEDVATEFGVKSSRPVFEKMSRKLQSLLPRLDYPSVHNRRKYITEHKDIWLERAEKYRDAVIAAENDVQPDPKRTIHGHCRSMCYAVICEHGNA